MSSKKQTNNRVGGGDEKLTTGRLEMMEGDGEKEPDPVCDIELPGAG